MQYILLNHVQENGWTKLTTAEQERGMAVAYAYNEALSKARAFVGSNRMKPS